jgi:hypothetical protein
VSIEGRTVVATVTHCPRRSLQRRCECNTIGTLAMLHHKVPFVSFHFEELESVTPGF